MCATKPKSKSRGDCAIEGDNAVDLMGFNEGSDTGSGCRPQPLA